MIVTKSIGRFSRNTIDTLAVIRELRERNVDVWFEIYNMHTLDQKGEVNMSLLSALAQEESRNMSENIHWVYESRFMRGETFTKYKNFYGFTCENDELVIVPEEAKVVQEIFVLYLEGKSLLQIKKHLEGKGIKTSTGKEKWDTKTIQQMLSNEKYMGEVSYKRRLLKII